jgi:predicted nucleic acid binding AN1-type Zn finger protein
VRFESRRNQHWQAKSNQLRCCLCSSCGHRKTTVFKCAKCYVGLCVVPCFAEYHTKVNL